MFKSCAITGHRPSRFSFGYDEEHFKCIELKKIFYNKFLDLINKGVEVFFSGMALGVDIWAAEVVIDLRKRFPNIKLICVLPCETQADRWAPNQRERYFNIIEKSQSSIYISNKYTRDCMYKRNKYMVDNSDVIVAVYEDILVVQKIQLIMQ